MLERFTARSGAASLRIDGVALHSPYDPAREAARFVEGALGGETPSTVVLLGEGLGHATYALEQRLPGIRILRVFYSQEIAGLCEPSAHPGWHPGSPVSIGDFLRANIGELDMEGLRALEWQPSAASFPALSRAAHQGLRQVLQELNGSLVTTVSAGRLWIRNTLANFLLLDHPLSGPPCGPDRTVLIAASGPSIQQALPFIARARAALELWALPSSVPFLLHAGLRPDLVVMTDPGHWSMVHLHFDDPQCPIAMPLSAARGVWRLAVSTPLLLGQPAFYEEALLAAAGLGVPRITPHGTVAASAIDLALAATRGPVVAAGLDMCTEDLALHCRPNAFDVLLRLQETRTAPLHSLSFHRVASQEVECIREGENRIRIPRSLRTYAGWFTGESPLDRGRLHRLLASAVELPRLRPLDGPGFLQLAEGHARAARGPGLRPAERYPDRRSRRAIVQRIAGQWEAAVEHGRSRLRAGGGLAVFAGSPELLPLAYHVDPRGLLDARRKARAGSMRAALETGEQVLDACGLFLASCVGKALGA